MMEEKRLLPSRRGRLSLGLPMGENGLGLAACTPLPVPKHGPTSPAALGQGQGAVEGER